VTLIAEIVTGTTLYIDCDVDWIDCDGECRDCDG